LFIANKVINLTIDQDKPKNTKDYFVSFDKGKHQGFQKQRLA